MDWNPSDDKVHWPLTDDIVIHSSFNKMKNKYTTLSEQFQDVTKHKIYHTIRTVLRSNGNIVESKIKYTTPSEQF